MPAQIPAAGRTMNVFEIFAKEKRELTKRDMARLLDVPDSSCSDLLHTLHMLGYLMRTPKTRRYYPSIRLYEIAREIAQNDPLGNVAQEAVDHLVEITDESSFFGVLETDAARIAAAQYSQRPLRYVINVGQRISLHSSALGQALLGLLPADEARAVVAQLPRERRTHDTIIDPDLLLEQIAKGRERGWYETTGEASENASGLAVSGWLGGLPVAISIGGPTERVVSNREKNVQALQAVRNSLLSDN